VFGRGKDRTVFRDRASKPSTCKNVRTRHVKVAVLSLLAIEIDFAYLPLPDSDGSALIYWLPRHDHLLHRQPALSYTHPYTGTADP
jgi:hypothetical protein